MPDFAKTAANALKSISKNGRVLAISRPVVTFDNVTGEPTKGPTVAGTITGIVLPRYKGQRFNSLDDSLKEALVAGRLRSILAAANGASFPPQPLDVISFDGSDWRVIGVTELSPTGIPIIYTIGVVQTGFNPQQSDS